MVVRLDGGLRCLAVARAIICRRADGTRFLFSTDELTEEKDDPERVGLIDDVI
jgi:hypothetical protein